MEFEERIEKITALADAIKERKDELIEASIADIGFNYKNSSYEIELTSERLKNFTETKRLLAGRIPICKENEEVALLLPYNGSAWLNIAIVSIFLAGNKVRVKFSSKGPGIAKIFEGIYKNIFYDGVNFDYRSGREFMDWAIRSSKIKALCVFGSDSTVLPYEEDIRRSGKKLIFEGPGNDPFIILEDADLKGALKDLKSSKYIYSGQACIAPERIIVHETIYEDFLKEFIDLTKLLVVGENTDPKTDVGPVASEKAVENIKILLNDAEEKGGKTVLGGKIDGNLVYPTILGDATQEMLGMQREIFGPVSFVAKFNTIKEAIRLAKYNRYGLRASIYGEKHAKRVANELKGEDYLHEVKELVFGKFGTVSINDPLSEAWKGALITKPIGGYGYSGWVWETVNQEFKLEQGPKLFSIETSLAQEV